MVSHKCVLKGNLEQARTDPTQLTTLEKKRKRGEKPMRKKKAQEKHNMGEEHEGLLETRGLRYRWKLMPNSGNPISS